jgi:crossover junction endodeoxyribonuclease RuvC
MLVQENVVIALGIDPGTRFLGWGVVRREGNRLSHVAHGVIRLTPTASLAERLHQLDCALTDVLERHQPDVGSVETLFFHKDAQAAAKLGHARGVVLLNFARRGIAVAEYQPAKVKRTIAGRGQADKRQVALMVRAVLALNELPAGDAADALALAVTHLRVGPAGLELTRRPVKPRGRNRGIPPALALLLASRARLRAGP